MKNQRSTVYYMLGALLAVIAVLLIAMSRREISTRSKTTNGQALAEGQNGVPPNKSRFSSKSTNLSPQDRVEVLIQRDFSDIAEKRFYSGPGDLAFCYKEAGLMGFYDEIRGALRGSEESLAEIFTTYLAEPEAYGGVINRLIENLGDDIFVEQIKKQSEETQFIILGQIWSEAFMSPLDAEKEMILREADTGRYYPKCAELFVLLLEDELKSPYWRKRKRQR